MSVKRVNKPFVALLALVVGTGVGAYIVAAGPPLKEVSTYMVVREAPFPTRQPSTFAEITVQAECNPGDLVTGGGYDTPNGLQWTKSFGEIFVQSLESYTNTTTGAEGWSVYAYASPPPDTSPPPPDISLRVTAICLHRA